MAPASSKANKARHVPLQCAAKASVKAARKAAVKSNYTRPARVPVSVFLMFGSSSSCTQLTKPHFDFLRDQVKLFRAVMHSPERTRFLESFYLAWQITSPMEKEDWMGPLDLEVEKWLLRL